MRWQAVATASGRVTHDPGCSDTTGQSELLRGVLSVGEMSHRGPGGLAWIASGSGPFAADGVARRESCGCG